MKENWVKKVKMDFININCEVKNKYISLTKRDK